MCSKKLSRIFLKSEQTLRNFIAKIIDKFLSKFCEKTYSRKKNYNFNHFPVHRVNPQTQKRFDFSWFFKNAFPRILFEPILAIQCESLLDFFMRRIKIKKIKIRVANVISYVIFVCIIF